MAKPPRRPIKINMRTVPWKSPEDLEYALQLVARLIVKYPKDEVVGPQKPSASIPSKVTQK